MKQSKYNSKYYIEYIYYMKIELLCKNKRLQVCNHQMNCCLSIPI